MRRCVLVLGLLAGGCDQASPAPSGPDGFALTVPVMPSEASGVQRIALPPVAVAALQRDDAGDVRIHDRDHRPLALALADTASRAEGQRTVRLKALPLPMAMPRPLRTAPVRIDQETGAPGGDGDDQRPARRRPEAGMLFDTRQLDDPVLALDLDAAVPKGVLAEVAVAASGDLKSWEPLGSKVLLGSEAPPDLRIVMPWLPLTDRYVRLSWQPAEGFAIKGASAVTARIPPPRPMVFATTGARLDDDHTLRFRVPLGVTLIGVRITGQTGEGIVPLTLSGRNSAEEAWRPLARGALRNGSTAQLDFPTIHLGEYRARADPHSPGFAATPRVELLTAPIVVLAAFNDKPPYTMQLGNAAAVSTYQDRRTLLGRPRSDAALPETQVRTGPAAPLDVSPGSNGIFTARSLALWAALLVCLVLLGFAARRALRSGGDQTI